MKIKRLEANMHSIDELRKRKARRLDIEGREDRRKALHEYIARVKRKRKKGK